MVSTFIDSKVIAKESGEEQQKRLKNSVKKLSNKFIINEEAGTSRDINIQADNETANLRQFCSVTERSKR